MRATGNNMAAVTDSVDVLGVSVDDVDMDSTLGLIEGWVSERKPRFVATVNPEFVMLARRYPGFRAVLQSADLRLPDGWGVAWAARRNGRSLERVTGSDLVLPLARRAAERGWRLFLLGAGPGIAEQAAGRLREEAPGVVIAGSFSGEASEAGDAETAARIAEARPDVLLVAYGAPKQELWIVRNSPRLGIPVSIGVGGAFDYLSGRIPRAPAWMREAGFEWLFRLGRQPWRARRMTALPAFALAVLREGRQKSPDSL